MLAGALMPCQGLAAEPDWYVEEGAGWRSRATALDASLLVSVDGRQINPIKSSSQSGKSSSTPANPDPGSEGSVIKTTVNNIAVSHEAKLDSKRNALRILDVLTNNDSKEKHVRVEFRTVMRSHNQLKFNGFLCDGGEVIESGNPAPDKTHAIVLLAELPGTPAVPLFVWGDRDAAWPVTLSEVGSSLRLVYEGDIKPGEKVALVHWVATAGLDKAIKLERTFDLFLKDGKLIDPMLDAEILPHVVNFKPGSLIQSEPPAVVPESTRLIVLDKLCEKLGIKREDKDILWMSKDEMFKGVAEFEKLSFGMGDRVWEIDGKNVAAIRGGGGRGRDHRLYLRDGSVWDGRVKFTQARLTGDIGTMTLDGDALELLLSSAEPVDGRPAEGAQGFVQTLNGRQFWIKSGKVLPASLITSFGGIALDGSDIWLTQRRMEPPYHQTVTLIDGSRINGVLSENQITLDVLGLGEQSLSISELSRWGTMDAWRHEVATGTAKEAKAEPPTRYCWLRDGSFLVGTLTGAPLLLHTNHEDVAIKSEEIARVAALDGDSLLVTVELLNGSKLKGRFLQDSLPWQLGKQAIALPVGLITELVRKDKP